MTLSIAAAVYAGASPQVRLVAASTVGAPSPIPNNTRVTVSRTHADGTVHAVMTETSPRLAGGAWVWLDAHCPFNQGVTYSITAAGFTATSGVVWLVSDRTWLMHPTVAALAVPVVVISEIATRVRSTRSARFTPLGGPAVFLTDGARDGVKGAITIRVPTSGEHLFAELIADDSVLLINTPGGPGWDLKWLWVQPGDVSFDNRGGVNSYPYRQVTVPFEESADPVVGIEPVWTDDASYAYWGGLGVTADGLATKYATDNDFITDTRL